MEETIIDKSVAFIGDVHGCRTHLVSLLQKLDGRHLIFLGDIVDKGPESGEVLSWIWEMWNAGECSVILGNHDDRLYRYLIGNPVKITEELLLTLLSIGKAGWSFDLLRRWIREWPLFIESFDWIAVHAAWRDELSFKKYVQICLRGGSEGHSNGHPIRTYAWRDEYRGDKKLIVHGHDPTSTNFPSIFRKNDLTVVNLDTGAFRGGPLSALLYPEMEIVRA